MYIYVSIYISIYTYVYVYAYTYVYIYTCTCMSTGGGRSIRAPPAPPHRTRQNFLKVSSTLIVHSRYCSELTFENFCLPPYPTTPNRISQKSDL